MFRAISLVVLSLLPFLYYAALTGWIPYNVFNLGIFTLLVIYILVSMGISNIFHNEAPKEKLVFKRKTLLTATLFTMLVCLLWFFYSEKYLGIPKCGLDFCWAKLEYYVNHIFLGLVLLVAVMEVFIVFKKNEVRL